MPRSLQIIILFAHCEAIVVWAAGLLQVEVGAGLEAAVSILGVFIVAVVESDSEVEIVVHIINTMDTHERGAGRKWSAWEKKSWNARYQGYIQVIGARIFPNNYYCLII